MDQIDRGKYLDSWKEISAYLGRNIRTCQIWEHELGLPVHRLDGSPKARVFAYTGELDAWRDEKLRGPDRLATEKARSRGFIREGKILGVRLVHAGLGILVVVIVLVIIHNLGGSRDWLFGPVRLSRITSLAVLPLTDFSVERSSEPLADGMTDALINGLAQIKGLKKVMARTSVMPYRDTKKTLQQIAKELSVEGIVEGSMTRAGGRVGIRARLIEARNGRQIGKPINLERDMTDVLALYADVVQAVAAEIQVQLTPQESERLKATRRVDPRAYDAALAGKSKLERANREGDIRQAIELFQKAVDLDPTYAPAWAGLGESLWYLAVFGFEFVPAVEVRDRSIAAAEKALELDETNADAHMARAIIALDGEWDVVKAERHFKRAIELWPGYANALTFYGIMLSGEPLLRFGEARGYLDRARELDPFSPWNDINLMVWWLNQGRPEKAFEEGARSWRRNPAPWSIRRQMGLDQLLLGRAGRAVPEFEAALELIRPERPAAFLGPLGLAYGLAGRGADAMNILAEMENEAREHYISPLYIAAVYSGLGRQDEAFRLLDRALDERTPRLVICTSFDPLTVAFRRDPRWKAFIDRLRTLVKLPPGTQDPYS